MTEEPNGSLPADPGASGSADFMSLLRSGRRKWRLGMINGPNMSTDLSSRNPEIYGSVRWVSEIEEQVRGLADSLGAELSSSICSNHEGKIVDWIQEMTGDLDGIIINPATLTPYGLSTVHALKDSGLPVIEVHFSNIGAHDIQSIFTRSVAGICAGLRRHSYTAALVAMVAMLDAEDSAEAPDP